MEILTIAVEAAMLLAILAMIAIVLGSSVLFVRLMVRKRITKPRKDTLR